MVFIDSSEKVSEIALLSRVLSSLAISIGLSVTCNVSLSRCGSQKQLISQPAVLYRASDSKVKVSFCNMKHQAIARLAERQNLESIVETKSIIKAKEKV